MRRIALRRLAAAALLPALALAACGGDDDGGSTQAPSVAASPSAAATTAPTSAPTPSATADLPAITVDVPAGDTTVRVPLTASGTANTFEAMLAIDVLDGAGSVLCRRSVKATSGTGTRGTWAATLAFPPPDAAMPATFRAFEFSPRDGSITNLVEVPVTVSPERPSIFITSPACNDSVAPGGTLAVEGRGVVFEATVNLQLRDATGATIVEGLAMAGGTEEMPFTTSIVVPAATTPGLYDLVAFNYSPRDGAIEHEFAVPVIVQ